MGLFDELGEDTFAPGRAARLALERELETRRAKWNRPGYFYRGAADLLLQHGSYFQGRELPNEYDSLTGAPNLCFDTALRAALMDSTLTYHEGVYNIGAGHFTTHGWVVRADGELLELTYPTKNLDNKWDLHTGPVMPPEHWGYWGVAFDPVFVAWHGEVYGLPMLDRSHRDAQAAPMLDMTETHDFPVLKVPYDRNRTTL